MGDLLVPVILCGGSGTRLWPLSRSGHPKQFLALDGERSLLQETWLRVAGLAGVAAPLVVTNEAHRFMVAEQLRQIDCRPHAIMLEPVGRNTAPAIAVAALQACEDGADPVLLVLPSDHVVADVAAFHDAVRQGLGTAAAGALVTFGIVPDGPETGYGYIRMEAGDGVRPVMAFVEKPDADTARAYVADGTYVWNSGMFLLRASRYLEELDRYRPDILQACRRAVADATHDVDFLRLDRTAFEACPSDSIDYAVMEKTDAARVVPMDVGWSDVGSWAALWEVLDRDAAGNAHRGDVLAIDCEDTLAWAGRRLVAMIGMHDTVVVDTDDALLVARRDQVQRVREVVAQLRQGGRGETELHRKVYRPWGAYDSVDKDERFQVKRITVKPGGKLSLQMHHHRAEHWVVVSGTARVTRGEDVFALHENESTFIPIGTKHRLENPGTEPLQLIEVQSGDYLGEDDIVRFEDVYGR